MGSTKISIKNLLAGMMLGAACTAATADAPPDPFADFQGTIEEKGEAIVRESDERDSGFGDCVVDLTMILRDRDGTESVRHIVRKTLEIHREGDKELDIFVKPPDVRGTTLLTYTHAVKPDEQWVYLPALKRVKRIASANKSGPFMGSEFAYEDIVSQEVEKYTYRYLRDEMIGEHDCYVIENTPAYEYSGYTRQVEWMDKTIFMPRRLDYYDRKGERLKTLILEDYHQYGKVWRAHHMTMTNHQTGKSSVLIWENFRFSTGLTERDFNRNALKRGK